MAAHTSFDELSTSPAHEFQNMTTQMLDPPVESGAFTETNAYILSLEPADDDARDVAGNDAMGIIQGQGPPAGLATTSTSINKPARPTGNQEGVNNGDEGQARGDIHVDDAAAEIDVVFDEDPGYTGDAEEVKQGTDAIAPPATGRRDRGLQKKSMNDEVQNDNRELVHDQTSRRGRPRKVESLAKGLGQATSASEGSPAGFRHNTRGEKKRVEALERERRELQRLAARPKTRGFQQSHNGFSAKISQPKEKGKEVVAVKSKRNKMTARQATLHTKAKRKGISKRMEKPKAKHAKRLNWKGEQMQLVRGQGHVVVPKG
ncbi:hypothetical protein KC318_g15144 [Hortaea werneckii]|nr:hypothetical protein KC355_g17505 [Hortaea werneckii]KAI7652219.1 hypothetical protein KC318_g15144 [Hortaea werneckii]